MRRSRGSDNSVDTESNSSNSLGIMSKPYLDGVFQSSEMPSVIRELVNPGDDPLGLLMRSVVNSKREAGALALVLSKLKEIRYKGGEETIRIYLAAICSLKGWGREQITVIATGQMPMGGIPNPTTPQAKRSFFNRNKNKENN